MFPKTKTVANQVLLYLFRDPLFYLYSKYSHVRDKTVVIEEPLQRFWPGMNYPRCLVPDHLPWLQYHPVLHPLVVQQVQGPVLINILNTQI